MKIKYENYEFRNEYSNSQSQIKYNKKSGKMKENELFFFLDIQELD